MNPAGATEGGVPAVRAVLRWAGRSLRREWRQQAIVFALLAVAVAAAVLLGALLHNTTGVREQARFGSATHRYTVVDAPPPDVAALAAQARAELGPVDVLGRWTAPLPGSVDTVDHLVQDPAGAHAAPMLALVEGRYPDAADEAGITDGMAETLGVAIGDPVDLDGTPRTIVGVVENPSDLQREFVLAAPDELHRAGSIEMLLGGDPAAGQAVQQLANQTVPGGELETLGESGSGQAAVAVLGGAQFVLVLVSLVASAGFAAVAQRRLRQLGLLSAVGATERHVTLLLASHGTFVGIAAALVGGGVGLGAWLAVADAIEEPVGYRIDPWHLPWWMIALLVVATIVSTTIAAWLPARAATRVPTLDALRGVVHPPAPANRSVAGGAGLAATGIALLLLGRDRGGAFIAAGTLASIVGLLALTPGMIEGLGRLAGRLPVAVRLAVRDLARHRSRSAVALAAVSLTLGVPAGIAIVSASADAADTLPNLPPEELVIWTKHPGDPDGVSPFYTVDRSDEGFAPFVPPIAPARLNALAATIDAAAADVDARTTPLPVVVDPGAVIEEGGAPIVTVARRMDGGFLDVDLVFAATPELLARLDVQPREPLLSSSPAAPAEVDADGSTLWLSNTSERPHAARELQLLEPAHGSLPSTLLTLDEVRARGWTTANVGWLLTGPDPFTPDEVAALRDLASREDLVVEAPEERRDVTSLRLGALGIGVAVALAVLAMTVGLIRVEAGPTRRVLTAVGASGGISRTVTAATSASIALTGAALGTAATYTILAAGFIEDRGTLTSVPAVELAAILVGFPVLASVGAWLAPDRAEGALARPMLD